MRMELNSRQKRLLRLVATGILIGEAATQCGYSASRASIIIHSPPGQEYLNQVEALGTEELMSQNAELELSPRIAVIKRLEAELPETLEQLIALRDGVDARVALGAVNSILDRGGVVAKTAVQVEQRVVADEGVLEALRRLGLLAPPTVPLAPTG